MGMIINPYRFQSAVWTPPNAVLWYYGSLLSGSQWADRIGSNHGTFQGGASADANGVECSDTKYISIDKNGINTLFGGNNVVSSSIWIKLSNAVTNGHGIVMGLYNNSVNEYVLIHISISSNPDRTSSCFGISGASGRSFYQSYDVSDGNWKHLATVYDATNSVNKIYINGSLQTGLSVGGTFIPIPSPSVNMIMGKYCLYIDDCILSNAAWSDDDVLDIYNNSPGTHKA